MKLKFHMRGEITSAEIFLWTMSGLAKMEAMRTCKDAAIVVVVVVVGTRWFKIIP